MPLVPGRAGRGFSRGWGGTNYIIVFDCFIRRGGSDSEVRGAKKGRRMGERGKRTAAVRNIGGGGGGFGWGGFVCWGGGGGGGGGGGEGGGGGRGCLFCWGGGGGFGGGERVWWASVFGSGARGMRGGGWGSVGVAWWGGSGFGWGAGRHGPGPHVGPSLVDGPRRRSENHSRVRCGPTQFERFLRLLEGGPRETAVLQNGIAFDVGVRVRCGAVPVLDFSGQANGPSASPVWRMSIQALQPMRCMRACGIAALHGVWLFRAVRAADGS